ncbi:MAG: hypothetical protein ACI4XA_07105 [Oscillospiraceae bacterium]
MKKNEHLAVRVIIFVVGIVVLAVAYTLLSPLFERMMPEYIFTCVSVSLLYLAVFLPILLGSARGGIASLAAAAAVYWKGLAAYFTASVVAIVLAFTFIPLVIPIIIQCVALFVFVIWMCLALVAKGHIESTARDEEAKKSGVTALRNRAGRLAALAAGLEKGDSMRAAAEKIAEDMRYLSPGNTAEAQDLERSMLAVLDTIITDSYFISGEKGPTAQLESKLKNFDALYRVRKNMR